MYKNISELRDKNPDFFSLIDHIPEEQDYCNGTKITKVSGDNYLQIKIYLTNKTYPNPSVSDSDSAFIWTLKNLDSNRGVSSSFSYVYSMDEADVFMSLRNAGFINPSIAMVKSISANSCSSFLPSESEVDSLLYSIVNKEDGKKCMMNLGQKVLPIHKEVNGYSLSRGDVFTIDFNIDSRLPTDTKVTVVALRSINMHDIMSDAFKPLNDSEDPYKVIESLKRLSDIVVIENPNSNFLVSNSNGFTGISISKNHDISIV